MNKLPKNITLEQVHAACAALGMGEVAELRLQRVSMMPDAVAVDHTVDTEVGPVLTTTRIGVTR